MTTRTIISALLASLITLAAAVAHAEDAKPADGTLRDVAVCNDGKTYANKTGGHMGACRGHGGVKEWKDGSPVKSKGGKGSSYHD